MLRVTLSNGRELSIHWRYAPAARHTAAWVFDKNKKLVATGDARQNPHDAWRKVMGRVVAVGRALKEMGLDKPERSKILRAVEVGCDSNNS